MRQQLTSPKNKNNILRFSIHTSPPSLYIVSKYISLNIRLSETYFKQAQTPNNESSILVWEDELVADTFSDIGLTESEILINNVDTYNSKIYLWLIQAG